MMFNLILASVILFSSLFVSAAYGSISTDKGTYSWTEKIEIRLMTHGYDPDRDTIRIFTSGQELESYRLSKAGNGLYTGKIILTGFLHDVDGDGKPDTNPRTMGSGSNNGFLEVSRDDRLTFSLEFADGTVMSKSAKIIWNHGEVSFDMPTYVINDSAKIQVFDPDMNLNPDTLDKILVHVYSDSDNAGILINAIETQEESGLFEATISFTQENSSSGNRLFFASSDAIFAKYTDYTLPFPHDINDKLDIVVESKMTESSRLSLESDSSEKAEMSWSQSNYTLSEPGTIQIVNPSQNLNPNIIDTFEVMVWSESDNNGIELLMKETDEATHLFVGNVSFTNSDESSGHRLRVSYGDKIIATYEIGSATQHTTFDDGSIMIESRINEMPISPLKQQKSGVEPKDVLCKDGFEKIFKYAGSIACVKPLTAEKLIHRGWGTSIVLE